MQQGWLKINDNGYSQITVEIEDKKIPLRYTVYQHERMLEFQSKKIEPKEGENFLKARAEADLEVCHIALNPMPLNDDFSKEDINEMLDLDQQRILSAIWIEKKVLNPSTAPNPESKKQGN